MAIILICGVLSVLLFAYWRYVLIFMVIALVVGGCTEFLHSPRVTGAPVYVDFVTSPEPGGGGQIDYFVRNDSPKTMLGLGFGCRGGASNIAGERLAPGQFYRGAVTVPSGELKDCQPQYLLSE